MKKAIACLLLALGFVAVLEPHVRSWMVNGVSGLLDTREKPVEERQALPFSRQLGSSTRSDMLDVTLYFRFADTNVLGAQRAQIDIRRDETIATGIIQHLLDGPNTAHEHLAHVFPQGTELISVSGRKKRSDREKSFSELPAVSSRLSFSCPSDSSGSVCA